MWRDAEKRGNKEKKPLFFKQNNSIGMECPSMTLYLFIALCKYQVKRVFFCKLSTAKFSSVSPGHIESCCTLH